MATITSDSLRAGIRATEAKAAQAFADAEKLKAEMIEAGVNPLEDKDAFAKLDEAYKAYDMLRDETAQMQAGLDRLAQIDGYVGRSSAGAPAVPLSGQRRPTRLGERVTASEGYAAMHRNHAFTSEAALLNAVQAGGFGSIEALSRDEFEMALSGLRAYQTTITGGGATSAGPFIQNDLIPGFVAYERKRPSLAAMVGSGVTDSDVVEYVTQSAPTSAAAETAEDTAASESTYPYATNTTNVREITHYVPITLRAMADYGQMRTIVENDLSTDALDRLDTQIAAGNGSGQNLTGIYNTGGIGTQALGADTRADALHKAITQIRVAAGVLGEPDFIGMHPNDWQKIRLEKDSNGQYLLGPAGQSGDRQVWGVPVVASTVFTAGTPLVGDFGGSSRLWLREGLSVTSGLNSDDFTKRRISLLAAIRVAFAVTRAGGFCSVTGF